MLEVNSSPGTEGIEEATGMNIARDVIKHFASKENRFSVPTECGYKEVVTIKPFGEIVAKFDTGNSGMPVIHADKYKIKYQFNRFFPIKSIHIMRGSIVAEQENFFKSYIDKFFVGKFM